jgi:hypothetical protein
VSVGVTPQTWAVLIDTAQNSDQPDVRRTAFACLSTVAESASMPAFEAASLRNLLRWGLTDEVPATRQAAHSFVCNLQQTSNPMQVHVAGVCCSADAPAARNEPDVRAAAQLVQLLDSMDASEDLGAPLLLQSSDVCRDAYLGRCIPLWHPMQLEPKEGKTWNARH